ncbi:MAG TPA: hypothetical protein PK767_06655 [Clostridiales bacterium]|jgi:hypothetical protein|nr:hypothetical protein [Bacillota bacterium]HOA56109.1 hypothetical protein [Clostridiales bacterium]HPP35908.1 hypothetical protein [Clostridiales bacterium]HPZ05236.1 hypothetical protein [Clostridiales bacterium]
MGTRNLGISPINTCYIEDSNLIKNQGTSLMPENTFKDIIIGLLGKEDVSNKNVNSLQRNICRTNYADSTLKVTRNDAKLQKKVESAVMWLANYLGIKPSLLLAVFSELGIDPNDMADKMKFLEIINTLAEHFNLNEKEKDEIMREMGGILGFSI